MVRPSHFRSDIYSYMVASYSLEIRNIKEWMVHFQKDLSSIIFYRRSFLVQELPFVAVQTNDVA